MERMLITIPLPLKHRLKALAAERGISTAALIREFLEEKACEKPRKPHFGIFDSGPSETARASADLHLEPPSWR